MAGEVETMANDGVSGVSAASMLVAIPRPPAPKADAKAPSQGPPPQGDVYVASGADKPGLAHHVLFFDENGDHQITLAESRHGLEKLGMGTVASAGLALVLNPVLGKQGSGHYTTTVPVDGLFKNF